MKDLVISVVAPVSDGNPSVREFIEQTTAVLERSFQNYELVLVDDGTSDGTAEAIEEALTQNANIRQLVLSRRYGRQIALTAGLDHAIGDFVVLMSADMRDPPELIPELVNRAQEGFDFVYSAKPPDQRESFIRRVGGSIFHRVAAHFTGFDLPGDGTDFRVFSRRAVNFLTRLKEHNRYMRMLYAYVGGRMASVPYPAANDRSSTNDDSLKEKLALAVDAIIGFSSKPLRYVAVLSLCVSGIALLGSLFVILDKLLSQNVVEGWASLMLLELLMFSILFLFLAVISEYVSRILVESKHRPLYYIREERGGTDFNIENIVDVD